MQQTGISEDKYSLLITALIKPELYKHPVDNIQLIETHISWVILTGCFAYKIKKPVDLGFVDFSTLEKRRFYCHEEVRLNRRLAANTYLQVVPITGTVEQPCWSGTGEIIEYAVKMVQFPQQAQLDCMLERGELKAFHIDAFAHLIADFHQTINNTSGDTDYGNLEHLYHPVKENLVQLRERISSMQADYNSDNLDMLQDWCISKLTRLKTVFEQRKEMAYIRECHGDMHLRNMAWIEGEPLLFDCIEFNPNLRWIDVISDTAFLVMDLHKREQFYLAQRFLNNYLERTGDYGGVRVLLFYLVYRALVRAKVEAIRASQSDINAAEQAVAEQALQEYLQLAQNYTRRRQLRLILTHGFSACGKSTISQLLLEQLDAIRIRSDVERKRLFGLQAQDNGQSAVNQDIYSTQASEQTYDKLAELAQQILVGGFSVIIDAACLRPEQRLRFQMLAATQHIVYVILDITASEETLRQRIQQRTKGVSDADLRVLEHQLMSAQKLQPDEQNYIITVDTEEPLELKKLLQKIETFQL